MVKCVRVDVPAVLCSRVAARELWLRGRHRSAGADDPPAVADVESGAEPRAESESRAESRAESAAHSRAGSGSRRVVESRKSRLGSWRGRDC